MNTPGCRYCGDPEYHDGEECPRRRDEAKEEARETFKAALEDHNEEPPQRIRVWYEGRRLMLEVPLVPGALEAMRKVPGRKYVGGQVNSFPARERDAVWLLLRRLYAGVPGEGPKGAFVVPPLVKVTSTANTWESWRRERYTSRPLAQDMEPEEECNEPR